MIVLDNLIQISDKQQNQRPLFSPAIKTTKKCKQAVYNLDPTTTQHLCFSDLPINTPDIYLFKN